jgi:hypothetical protein
MSAALEDRGANGGPELAAKAVEVFGREVGDASLGSDARLPEGLIGEQVADSGDRSLIQQSGFDRRAAAADQAAELVAADLCGVRADVGEVWVEDRAPESALVPEDHSASVVELEREAIPAGSVIGVDDDPARHAEMQSEDRAVIGLQPHELSPAVCARERVADERVGDLAWRVGTAHVGISIVDADDSPAEDRFQRLAGALCLGQLRHPSSLVANPRIWPSGSEHDHAGEQFVKLISLVRGERLEKPSFTSEQKRERVPAEPVAGSGQGDGVRSAVVFIASSFDEALALEFRGELEDRRPIEAKKFWRCGFASRAIAPPARPKPPRIDLEVRDAGSTVGDRAS